MIMKRKNIQIPTDLFLNLCNYHLAGIRSPEQDQRIQQGLQNKLDAVKRRSDYHQKRDAYDKLNECTARSSTRTGRNGR